MPVFMWSDSTLELSLIDCDSTYNALRACALSSKCSPGEHSPDDEDSYDVVPNSQFVISRTAFKDNSSYYTIDNKRVQFKEVAKLLRFHGIDLDHNRFLILQGEVEQIAMMKPKGATEHETGMLEFLEDIIGTSRFK
ncbi:unnamed protein product, partial [Timema podura]|nr:unnamed protein product [Timema podura]